MRLGNGQEVFELAEITSAIQRSRRVDRQTVQLSRYDTRKASVADLITRRRGVGLAHSGGDQRQLTSVRTEPNSAPNYDVKSSADDIIRHQQQN